MKFRGFSLENYRSFVDLCTIEVEPLTLLFGYNSAGKSSLIRFLPLLAASTRPGASSPISLEDDSIRAATFKDLLSRQDSRPFIKLGLKWSNGNESSANITIRDLPERKIQIIDSIELKGFGVGTVRASWSTAGDPTSIRHYDCVVNDTPCGPVAIPFEGIVPVADGQNPAIPPLKAFSNEVRLLSKSVHWINSLRTIPERSVRFRQPPTTLSSNGSNASEFLAYDSLSEGKLVQEVSRWFESATGHRLRVSQFAAGTDEMFSILLSPVQADRTVEVPIVDTGEGMAQVMPVLVLLSLAQMGRLDPNSILAIEHPELHLHPAAHAELAEEFCRVASSVQSPAIVVETHSENFLLRVQIAILKGELRASDAVVHWIRQLPDGRSVVDTIRFDEAARPMGAGWPPGAFLEDTVQARELLRLRKERGFA